MEGKKKKKVNLMKPLYFTANLQERQDTKLLLLKLKIAHLFYLMS